MPFAEKQKLAHKALTSRQGRLSVVPVIADLVSLALLPTVQGMEIVGDSKGTLFIETEWGMQIDGGINERNPNFNYVDTAARSLTNKLLRELKEREACDAKYELVVTPINAITERRVGWRAALYAS